MNDIERFAIDVRADLGIPDDERPSALDTLRRARFRGIIEDFGPDLEGDLGSDEARWVHDKRTILVSPRLWEKIDDDDGHVRFVIFHELGHVILNHVTRNRKAGGTKQHGSSIARDEDEADIFALAFAIPLTFAFKTDVRNAQGLMQQFGLTKALTELRMVDLRLYVQEISKNVASPEFTGFVTDRSAMNTSSTAELNTRTEPTKDEDWDF